jgi:CheY-like chemotaxis protein
MTINVLLISENRAYATEIGKALARHDLCVVYGPGSLIGGPMWPRLRPDLILIDLQRTDLSEHLLSLQLCKFQCGKRIPVIALTTEGGSGARYRAAASGCDDLIRPVIDSRRFAQELIQIVERVTTRVK